MWQIKEIKQALNIKVEEGDENQIIRNISIDSRKINKDDIFVALKGEKFDAHNFLKEVSNKGASYAIVEKENSKLKIKHKVKLLEVPSTYQALLALAKYKRKKSKAKFIAITGSVGKTSYKETLASFLKFYGNCYYSKGNFNNHIGLPLMLANLDNQADYAIFELGMNHLKEIEFLSNIVKADISIITKISENHIANLANIKEIVVAKAEIASPMKKTDYLIVNDDNQLDYLYKILINKYKLQNENIVFFGNTKMAKLKIMPQIKEKNTYYIPISYNNKIIKLEFNDLLNQDLAILYTSIIAVIDKLNLDFNKIINLYKNIKPLSGRGAIIKKDNMLIINDCYNAGPVSMKSALNYLGSFKTKKRKIAVIGTMLELGSESLTYHLELKDVIINNDIDGVITVGKYMDKLFDSLPKKIAIEHFEQIENNIKKIKAHLKEDDLILLKASNAVNLSLLL